MSITLGADGCFQRAGRRLIPVGVNYWPASCGVEMWNRWPAEEIRADVALVRRLGLNCIRFFLRWQDFEPKPGRYDPRMWRRLEALLQWCAEQGVLAHPSFFVGWMSGGIFWPEWKGRRNLFSDPDLRARAASFAYRAARICSRCRDAVLAIDLGNELCCLPESAAASPAEVAAWSRAMRRSIRRGFPDALVVTGNEQMQVTADTGWRLDGDSACEVGSMHTYPNPAWHSIGFDGMGDPLARTLLPFYVKCARAFGPVMAQEFGTLFSAGPDAKAYVAAVLRDTWAAGANGFLWWCLRDIAATGHPYDKNGFEGGLGLVDGLGRVKPALKGFLAFAARIGTESIRPRPASDLAIYWPQEYYARDNPLNPGNDPRRLSRRMIAAHFALESLGCRVGIARGDLAPDDWPARRVVIPGALLTAAECRRLIPWVRAGGRLIWHGIEATTFGREAATLLGGEPTDFHAPQADAVKAFGRRWEFDAFPKEILVGFQATTARVCARDRRGRALLMKNRLGKGIVVSSPALPEEQFAAEAGDPVRRRRWLPWFRGALAMLEA